MMKSILIGENNLKEMTFEEVHEKYKALLKKKAYGWSQTYEFDELMQIGSIALWKAYEKYDVNKYPIAFGFLAKMYIDNALLAFHAKNKPKTDNRTSKIKSIISMEAAIFKGKNGDELKLEDLLGEDEIFTEQVANKLVLNKVFSKFTEQQRKDIEAYISGFKLGELAEKSSLSKQAVSLRLKNNFMKFRAIYIKEMMG